jgi:hypothetical protein
VGMVEHREGFLLWPHGIQPPETRYSDWNRWIHMVSMVG